MDRAPDRPSIAVAALVSFLLPGGPVAPSPAEAGVPSGIRALSRVAKAGKGGKLGRAGRVAGDPRRDDRRRGPSAG